MTLRILKAQKKGRKGKTSWALEKRELMFDREANGNNGKKTNEG